MKNKINFKKGFTMIEIIVVFAVIAILVAIAIPTMTHYIDAARNNELSANANGVYCAALVVYHETNAEAGSVKPSDWTDSSSPQSKRIKELSDVNPSNFKVDFDTNGKPVKIQVKNGTHTAILTPNSAVEIKKGTDFD